MLVAALLRPLVTTAAGPVWCHAPTDEPFDVDALAGRGDGEDRWSDDDQPTAYLAGDPPTAIAEYARHAGGTEPEARDIVRLQLEATRVLDLRRPDVQAVLGSRSAPSACADRAVARALSREVRGLDLVQGLIVPSIPFLDDPSRFNVVLFVEALGSGIGGALGSATIVGSIRIDPR
jgi:RES domain-containing protein